jgi:hypothetical protein
MASRTRTAGARLAAVLLAAGLAAVPQAAPAQSEGVLVQVRILDRESGAAAGWGATGQVLLPAAGPAGERPGLPGLEERPTAVAPTDQELFVPAGGRGEIRLGRAIPYAGWFLRRARAAGLAAPEDDWRDVEAFVGVEALPPGPDGAAHLALTPELAYSQGRTRRRAAFAAARVAVTLPPGAEVRLAPGPGQEDFYARLLAGYGPLRRVRPIDLVLRAVPAAEEEP